MFSIQKLQDPHKLVDAKTLDDFEKRISACLTGLFRQPNAGGNPFLFTIAISKQHYLAADGELAEKIKEESGREVPGILRYATAATDGKSYLWHPDFIRKLEIPEMSTVMEHESLHVVFDHPGRLQNASDLPRAYAIDYVVNSCIEHNHKACQRKGQLWGGNLGDPVPLQLLLDHIDGKVEAFPDDKKARIFADPACYGRSPESIYDEILEHWDKSPRKCPECASLSIDPKTKKPKGRPCQNRPSCAHGGMCCGTCGAVYSPGRGGDGMPIPVGGGLPSPMDNHIDMKVSRQEVQNEVMKAVQNTKAMRGFVPSAVEDVIRELMHPTISFTDIIFSDCMRRTNEAGIRNDWSRPRKRSLAIGIYLPKRFSHKKRWLAMLDTSGSMGEKDMAYGVSQLKVLCGKGTEGVIVPVDAAPHWGSVTTIKNIDDLKTTKIAGRGGTVFEEFFRDFPKEVGTDFDAIVILTDGDCGDIPMKLKPPIPVTWVLTRHHDQWKPSFGRAVPLRHERL